MWVQFVVDDDEVMMVVSVDDDVDDVDVVVGWLWIERRHTHMMMDADDSMVFMTLMWLCCAWDVCVSV
jgi:hypothetical protein